MKFCNNHWQQLRQKINSRGLGDLVSESGEEVHARFKRAQSGEKSLDSYDPLMHAHMAIMQNAMMFLAQLGFDPIEMLNAQEGVEACPICYLNYLSDEHDKVCSDPECVKPEGLHFEFWLDKAADAAKHFAETLGNEK